MINQLLQGCLISTFTRTRGHDFSSRLCTRENKKNIIISLGGKYSPPDGVTRYGKQILRRMPEVGLPMPATVRHSTENRC